MRDVGFELESQMCRVLGATLSKALTLPSTSRIVREVQVGLVIPDLIAVSRPDGAYRTPVSSFESWIIADLMRARTRRPETLARRLFTQPQRVDRALQRLVRFGIVHRAGVDSFCLATDFIPNCAEVVAVEAKLTRWREAVDQATSYLRFANRAYVALPVDRIERNADLLATCRTRRLGLIAVGDVSADVVRAAPRHAQQSPGWVWLVARGGTPSARRGKFEHVPPRTLMAEGSSCVELAEGRDPLGGRDCSVQPALARFESLIE